MDALLHTSKELLVFWFEGCVQIIVLANPARKNLPCWPVLVIVAMHTMFPLYLYACHAWTLSVLMSLYNACK